MLKTAAAACLLVSSAWIAPSAAEEIKLARVENRPPVVANPDSGATGPRDFAGAYLSGLFAQQHHDWKKANEFMGKVLAADPNESLLLKRRMVLAMGSGDIAMAADLARKVMAGDDDGSLAGLFLSVDAFGRKEYDEASTYIAQMPDGGISDFIGPVLDGWAAAAKGEYKADRLNKSALQLYHAILIADYLKQNKHIEKLLNAVVSRTDITPGDLERIAGIYAHTGNTEKAVALYTRLMKEYPEYTGLNEKIEAVKAGNAPELFTPIEQPEHGVATALYDMARMLYSEYSDDSARLFAYMALHLKPDMGDARLMLALIASRNGRYDEAIGFYRDITPEHEDYLGTRQQAAALMEQAGRIEEAVAELEKLAKTYNDAESVIQIGDIYRREERFAESAEAYNRAAAMFDGEIPDKHWSLYYVRGMVYERLGHWGKAEKDLQTALAIRPDHPYILNYLGYSWADQGMHLEKSLELIRKASALRPSDGYITDSLGWVLYRLGHYAEAVPELEKAVELLPYDPVINDHLGDAYWQVGRKMEARFQWNRARNYSEDEKLIATLKDKLENGPAAAQVVKETSAALQQGTGGSKQ